MITEDTMNRIHAWKLATQKEDEARTVLRDAERAYKEANDETGALVMQLTPTLLPSNGNQRYIVCGPGELLIVSNASGRLYLDLIRPEGSGAEGQQ